VKIGYVKSADGMDGTSSKFPSLLPNFYFNYGYFVVRSDL
jgi:hypothetical protein